MEQAKPPGGARLLDRELARSRKRAQFSPKDLGVAPLALSVLVPDTVLPADLFLPIFKQGTGKVELDLAAKQGEVFRARWRQRLEETGQSRVFVRLEDLAAFSGYLERNIGAVFEGGLPLSRKAELVRETASFGLRASFTADLSDQSISRGVGIAQDVVQGLARQPQILHRLSGVLAGSYSIYSHCVNVCLLSVAFGRYQGMTEGQARVLGMAGMLHDVGMTRLPPALLEKTSPLKPGEWAQIKRHPRLGYELLLPIGAVSFDVLQVVLRHHENYDGSGYPDGLEGEKIPFLARVLRLVDTYDAMTTASPFREAKSPKDAAGEMLEIMGEQLDRQLVPHFVRFLGSPEFAGG